MESEILQFCLNNGVGALFGFLMWFQANTTIKSNTKALTELKSVIQNMK